MSEQLNKGVTIPMTNIGTDINRGTSSKIPLEQNDIVTLTANTNTTHNREFRSALELAEYNIKVNKSASLLRDTNAYSSSNKNGTHYDRQLTLRDLGRYMSERMYESIKNSGETYNINLKGKMVLGSPDDGTNIIDTFANYAGTGKQAVINNLNGAGTLSGEESNDFDLDSAFSKKNGYIGSISTNDFIRRYCDTQSGIAMGQSKVLNPDFQFNEMDDVRSNFRRPKIGRLYSERIYDFNLPTVYFCPGKVEVRTNTLSLVSAFTKSDSNDLTNYLKDVNTNAIKVGVAKMGNLLHSATSMAAKKIIDTAQWYKWSPLTIRYTKYVNEMLIQLAVWMGLIDASSSGLLQGWQEELNKIVALQNGNDTDEAKNDKVVKEVISKSWKDLFSASPNIQKVKVDKRTKNMIVTGYLGSATVPKHTGLLSVLTILPQYSKNKWIVSGDLSNSDEVEDYESNEADENGNLPEEMFIPFGMCKGVSVSETFSNSLGEHPLLSEYNQMYSDSNAENLKTGFNMATISDKADKAGAIMNGLSFKDENDEMSLGTFASGLAGNVASYALSNAASLVNQHANNELGMVTSGAGRFVLPEIWTDSTFDRSYSITFKFRSPYGHRLSIYENTMVPLLFLISMTAPRAVGMSSYTNPFYIKAFSKGLFSCDLGMITSLSISRGEDKNDRTVDGFFRTVTASVSIKDVLPTMQMGLDIGKWSITNSLNSGMISYMCNLAGVDFIERANLSKNIKFLTQRLTTQFEEFGSSTRSWISSRIGGAQILGLSAKSFGLSKDPMNDRKYHSNYN